MKKRPDKQAETAPPTPPTGSVLMAGRTLHADADTAGEPVDWHLADEVPVALVYNGEPHAVMMATPHDLEDFALGFSIAEEIIDAPDALLVAKSEPLRNGIRLCMTVDPDRTQRGFATMPGLEGRSGCGVCGVADIDAVVRVPPSPIRAAFTPNLAAFVRALEALPGDQPMNRVNRSLHVAAFCAPDGRIRLAREDIGRHNAMDKVIGAVLRAGIDPATGFVALSSRCSFELVQKAAAVGIPHVATLSAPTALAVDLARRSGIWLAAWSGPGQVVVFNHTAAPSADAPS